MRCYCICVILMILLNKIVTVKSQQTDDKLPEHNKRLGSHRAPEGNIEFIDKFPSAPKFYEEFVLNSRAVLFKGVCRDFPAANVWSDEYLRSRYGTIKVRVDRVKVEDRHSEHDIITINEFLDVYNTSKMYLVDTLPEKMTNDFYMPDCLLCGGFENMLQDFVIWFSSGGSKSHLHMDTVENINCMVSGSKQWFLVNKENTRQIIMDHEEGDYCSVDVDRVDMIKYPFLKNIPWWNVTVEQGDCIYVPYGWGHQVTSSQERNIAINIWWTPMSHFNMSSCNDVPSAKTLHDFRFTPSEQYRFQLKQLLDDNKGPVNFHVMHSNVVSEHTGVQLISHEDFNLLDKNGDGLIDANEIQEISSGALRKVFDNNEPGIINIRGQSIDKTRKSTKLSSDEQIIQKNEL